MLRRGVKTARRPPQTAGFIPLSHSATHTHIQSYIPGYFERVTSGHYESLCMLCHLLILRPMRHTTCMFHRVCSPSSWDMSCCAAEMVSCAFVTSASNFAASAVWHWNLSDKKKQVSLSGDFRISSFIRKPGTLKVKWRMYEHKGQLENRERDGGYVGCSHLRLNLGSVWSG